MPSSADRQRFRNEDLILKVSTAIDRSQWDESRYDAFLDELCGSREYQKNAICTALRYMLGGEYDNLEALARSNYNQNALLEARYGSWNGMKRYLQLPDALAASLDLATGTGKSYILYGIAVIMLAEGIVDRVLVLCPSTTIEAGLLDKFRALAANSDLSDQLPGDAKISIPSVITASQTLTEGSLCVENYHAILERTGSSIRDSLMGHGERTLVLNDEAHHVANEPAGKSKRWKEFLTDPEYGFRYIIGVSGTCYINDDYFSDVIYRYSLREAMEEKYVKRVEYVAEMPKTNEHEDVWQLIYNRHEEIKKKLKRTGLVPLTIIVTQTIARCEDVADELRAFLIDTRGYSSDLVKQQVLVVYNNAPDVLRLPYVDSPSSNVEWIVSVSMLNEGWDVKRVFQIVPHEERAFNSKLLIAQVLGRGLRVPENWKGAQPEVTVFNHDAWASRIKHLVNEILEIEKRLSSHVIADSPYHFDLDQIDYTVETTSEIKDTGSEPYVLFDGRDYVNLADDVTNQDVKIEFERAGTDNRYTWQTQIRRATYTPRQVAEAMYERLEQAQDPNDPNPALRTVYTDQYPVERLEQIVTTSLARKNMTVATESMKQKFLRELRGLHRGEAKYVRFTTKENRFFTISTQDRQTDHVSAAELRSNKTYFWTDETRNSLKDEQLEFFDEATESGSGYKCYEVRNRRDFLTPLNGAIADSENERRFVRELLDTQNLVHFTSWLKSTAVRFYDIDYVWYRGIEPKRGKFSPDFFIQLKESLVLVIEVKDDDQLAELDEENKAKNQYALAHFALINEHLAANGKDLRYQFNFLTPRNFSTYFQKLRQGEISGYQSDLDIKLIESSRK